MKKKSFLLLGLSVVLIISLGVGGVLSFRKENSLSYDYSDVSDTDDLSNVVFSGGEFDYQMTIGTIINVNGILSSFKMDMNNVDYSTLKFVSNEDATVVNVDENNSLVALSEGEDKVVFTLNDKNVVLNLTVRAIETSNASVETLVVKSNGSPRYKVSVTDGTLYFTAKDNSGLKTKNITLSEVDVDKNVIKKLNLSCKLLLKNKKKTVRYGCEVTDKDVLKDGKNYFYISLKDDTGNSNLSYFTVEKKKNKYYRSFAPSIEDFDLYSNSSFGFYVKDGDKIKSLTVYDGNNGNKVVLEKKDMVSSDVVLSIKKLKKDKSNRYSLIFSTEDEAGNRAVRSVKYRIVKEKSEIFVIE